VSVDTQKVKQEKRAQPGQGQVRRGHLSLVLAERRIL